MSTIRDDLIAFDADGAGPYVVTELLRELEDRTEALENAIRDYDRGIITRAEMMAVVDR